MGMSHFSGLNIGSGCDITAILGGSVTIDPPSLAAGAEATVSFTATGCNPGDAVTVNTPAAGLTAGLVVAGARVSAANTVSVRLRNTSAGVIDEAAETWTYLLFRLS